MIKCALYHVLLLQHVGEAPRFKRGLSMIRVELGQPIKLNCQVESEAKPQVVWYRNGIELTGQRFMYVVFVCFQRTV